jgi:DNA mismatch repair protein MutL
MKANARIQQLDPLLSNQIAAGEVVERPASIVKELVENSIDALASKIEVEIEGGGKQLIRIRDNGFGIVKSDLNLAFARHATSKIHTVEDLAGIISMGFRGEALASIASVARCRLTSKAAQADHAWQIEINSDLSQTIVPAAHPVGTTIEVADLFYNTPARRKFLRSERSEFQSIEEIMKRLALAYPKVSFTLKHHQKLIKTFPGVSDLVSESARIGKICGPQFLENAQGFAMSAAGLDLKGWLGAPTISRRQADCQYFFVNNRAVRDRLLNHAVKAQFQLHPDMIEGSYPCYVLYLTLDPKEVDVNVHPTKQEVRFRQTRLIHDFISKCIEEVLLKSKAESTQVSTFQPPSPSYTLPCQKNELVKKTAVIPVASPLRRYAFVEEEKGGYLVDLSRAKKTLLSHYFISLKQNVPVKSLLFPLRMNIENFFSDKSLQLFRDFGFVFKVENPRSVLLLQQPAFLPKGVTNEIITVCFRCLKNEGTGEALAATLGENLTLADLLCLSPDVLNRLLAQYVDQNTKGSWIYFSHEHIAAKIDQENEVLCSV